MAKPKRMRKLHPADDVPVIRGAIIVATMLLYSGPTIKRSTSLNPHEFPVQPNNLVQWFRIASKRFGSDMKEFIEVGVDELILVVNDGLGSKQGRGSNDNTFELQVLDDEGYVKQRLQFNVTTEAHARRSQLRKARGEPMQQRTDWSKETYHYVRENVVKVYDKDDDAQYTWDAEEYFAEHPHRRGQLKVRL
ncbi:hypothetical protein STASHLEY_00630 [Brevundimonas phage vB_BpoS-StAshley]|nr:hypothetical protein STASHLEY_00630 [Brevundimonas phage vB_BpoS-StAshley]